MATINISLPDSMKEFIDEQVEADGYSTVSEYLRQLVREDRKRKLISNLEDELETAINSGPATPFEPDYVDRMKAELRTKFENINESAK